MVDFLAKYIMDIMIMVAAAGFVFGFVTCLTICFREKGHKSRMTDYFYNIFLVCEEILPLLGTLGTVVGLLQIKDDTASLQAGFVTALDTTLCGLFFCIILKILDALIIRGIFELKDKEWSRKHQDTKNEEQ